MKFCWVAFVCFVSGAAFADCRQDHVHLQGSWGRAQFSVEIADTPAERSLGLMNRATMARDHGMLFVWDSADYRNFWMKNTLIPLDIMYFDSDGVLLNIAHMAKPGDLTGLPSIAPAQFVLEINGGLAERYQIDAETRLRHTAVKNSEAQAICLQ